MSDNLKNKKEEEALNYLEKNFVGENIDLDSVSKTDTSFLDDVPNNEFLHVPLEILP